MRNIISDEATGEFILASQGYKKRTPNLWWMALLIAPIMLLNCSSVWAETWVATAYCPDKVCTGKIEGDPYYGITASGRIAQEGRTVAANWLPFGTKLNINGKTYIVEDRGAKSIFGTRKNPKKRVDIFFSSHAEALRFGRRKVNLEVI